MAWTKEASTWVIGGFNQWNRGLEAIGNHEKSTSHLTAVTTVAVHDNGSRVDQQLSQRLVKDQADARIAMRAIVTTLLSLARQGLAIRGSTDEEGNLAEFLHRRAEDIPALKVWLTRETTWTSHDVQNEILELAAHQTQRALVEKVKAGGFFGFMADETTDAGGHEQVSICLRTVTDDLDPEEIFMGFVETSKTTGEALATLIKDVLVRLNLDIHLARSQTYDGVSNMSGKFIGTQAVISRAEKRCFYLHCSNHRLNLALQDIGKRFEIIRDALSLTHEIGKLFRESARRGAILNEISVDLTGEDASSLRPLCETRWTVRAKAISKITSQYQVIL